jgi:hypothetical protein
MTASVGMVTTGTITLGQKQPGGKWDADCSKCCLSSVPKGDSRHALEVGGGDIARRSSPSFTNASR